MVARKRAKKGASEKKPEVKRLYRSKKDRIIAGVCGGIGEYFRVDPTLIRLLWVVLILAQGIGVLSYVIFWLIVPENPEQ